MLKSVMLKERPIEGQILFQNTQNLQFAYIFIHVKWNFYINVFEWSDSTLNITIIHILCIAIGFQFIMCKIHKESLN